MQNSESNCWSSDSNEQFASKDFLVFNNRDMAEKTEHTQRNMQKAQKIAVALSAGIQGKVFLQGVWINAGS